MRSAPASLCMSLRASPCSKQVLAERSMLALSPRFARIRLLHGTGGRDALSVPFVRFACHVPAINGLSWRFGPESRVGHASRVPRNAGPSPTDLALRPLDQRRCLA
jgi:hypothetical protein